MTERIQTIDRMVSILDCFSLDEPLLGVREVSRKTGLSSSTTGRMMAYLSELGILNQDPETLSYMMGSKVLAWAGIYTISSDIRSLALTVMVRLQEKTRETISLYVLEGNERVCVERLESPETVRIVARVGRRIPLYAGSAGKVFLAFMAEDKAKQILEETELVPMTKKTITERDDLWENLEKIRKQGFAVSKGEWILEASGVAAPVYDQDGKIAAALTVSGPTQRFTEDRIREISGLVKDGASLISSELGHLPQRVR